MKNITIAGNIGRDAEVRNAGDKRVTGWTVAVDDGWGDSKSTMWFDCNWWGPRGEKVAQYINKGGKITVTGELKRREHEGKTFLSVDVTDVTLQSKGGQQSNTGPDEGSGYNAGGGPNSGRSDLDDEIPFSMEARV